MERGVGHTHRGGSGGKEQFGRNEEAGHVEESRQWAEGHFIVEYLRSI